MNKQHLNIIEDISQLDIPEYIDQHQYVKKQRCTLFAARDRLGTLDTAIFTVIGDIFMAIPR